MIYIHKERQSLRAGAFELFLKTFRVFENSLQKQFSENRFRSTPDQMPKWFSREFTINTTDVLGRNVYRIARKSTPSGRFVLYIHGGAYVANVNRQLWELVGELVRRTGATFVVPDYPLAPEHTIETSFPMVERVYSQLLAEVDAAQVVYFGDSAGGAFALALAQKVRDQAARQPGQIILLSPWLDATLTNPGIRAVEKKDRILEVEGLRMAAAAYAGGLDHSNFLISPINGDLRGLATISLFIGGHDIFIADARKLRLRLEHEGVPYNYYEYPHMFHVWAALTRMKESQKAIGQIADLIRRGH